MSAYAGAARRPRSLVCRAHFAHCVLDLLDPQPSVACEPRPLLNPLRSEDEAFRFLLYVLAVLVVIAALVLILRAVL